MPYAFKPGDLVHIILKRRVKGRQAAYAERIDDQHSVAFVIDAIVIMIEPLDQEFQVFVGIGHTFYTKDCSRILSNYQTEPKSFSQEIDYFLFQNVCQN